LQWAHGEAFSFDAQSGDLMVESGVVRNERMPVAADIHAKVTNLLMQVLLVDEDHVTPTATLQRDLGADSLDLLEIMFLLEHEFGIEIPRGELFPRSRFGIGSESVQDITVDLVGAYVGWKLGRAGSDKDDTQAPTVPGEKRPH
jgi:acyl carrier protein